MRRTIALEIDRFRGAGRNSEFYGKTEMSPTANDILQSIEALPDAERHQLTAAVLRRVLNEAPVEVSDDVLVLAAEELFQELDTQESQDDESQAR